MKKTEARSTMGARIKEMRLAAGMSQEQLAEKLCTKKCTISLYENDKIDIKSSIVLELAKALNCTGSYLKENLKPEMRGPELNNKKMVVSEGVDAELLMKVLSNPEMATLLTSLAKTMKI